MKVAVSCLLVLLSSVVAVPCWAQATPTIRYLCACLTVGPADQPCGTDCPQVVDFLTSSSSQLEMTLNTTEDFANWTLFTDNAVFDVKVITCYSESGYCSPFLVTVDTPLNAGESCNASATNSTGGSEITVLINCSESIVDKWKASSLVTFEYSSPGDMQRPTAVFILQESCFFVNSCDGPINGSCPFNPCVRGSCNELMPQSDEITTSLWNCQLGSQNACARLDNLTTTGDICVNCPQGTGGPFCEIEFGVFILFYEDFCPCTNSSLTINSEPSCSGNVRFWRLGETASGIHWLLDGEVLPSIFDEDSPVFYITVVRCILAVYCGPNLITTETLSSSNEICTGVYVPGNSSEGTNSRVSIICLFHTVHLITLVPIVRTVYLFDPVSIVMIFQENTESNDSDCLQYSDYNNYNICDWTPCLNQGQCLSSSVDNDIVIKYWNCRYRTRGMTVSLSRATCASVLIGTDVCDCPSEFKGAACEAPTATPTATPTTAPIATPTAAVNECKEPQDLLYCLSRCDNASETANPTTPPLCESLEVQLQVSGCYDTSCSANQSACNEICEEYQHLLTPVCVATLCNTSILEVLNANCGSIRGVNCSRNETTFALCTALCTEQGVPLCEESNDEERNSLFLSCGGFVMSLTIRAEYWLSQQRPDRASETLFLALRIVYFLDSFTGDMFMQLLDQITSSPAREAVEDGGKFTMAELNIFDTMLTTGESEKLDELIDDIDERLETLDDFVFNGSQIIAITTNVSQYNIVDNVFSFPPVGFGSNLDGTAQVNLTLDSLCGDKPVSACAARVGVAIVANDATLGQNTTVNNKTITGMFRSDVNSNFMSIRVVNTPQDFVQRLKSNPLRFNFKPLLNQPAHKCRFWNITTRQWELNGVMKVGDGDSGVMCEARHATTFAILVDLGRDSNPPLDTSTIALNVVSYVGCAISIVCLLLTIAAYLIFRKSLNKGPLLYIHLNLAIALLLGLIVFVAAVETATPVRWLCTLVAALLHYLFLCVFCWMLAEGIMLYLLVVRVFGMAAEKWYYLLILGWGLPLPLVAVSAGVLHESYGTESYCWIDADFDEPAIWLFVVPMALIIMINVVILVMTVATIVKGRIQGGAELNVKKVELVKSALKTVVILLPLLGLTWLIGIFAVNRNTAVFAWLFTIFNSLQGFFIFVLHVVRNEVVIRKIRLLCVNIKKKTIKRRQLLSTSSATCELQATKQSMFEIEGISLSPNNSTSELINGREKDKSAETQ